MHRATSRKEVGGRRQTNQRMPGHARSEAPKRISPVSVLHHASGGSAWQEGASGDGHSEGHRLEVLKHRQARRVVNHEAGVNAGHQARGVQIPASMSMCAYRTFRKTRGTSGSTRNTRSAASSAPTANEAQQAAGVPTAGAHEHTHTHTPTPTHRIQPGLLVHVAVRVESPGRARDWAPPHPFHTNTRTMGP